VVGAGDAGPAAGHRGRRDDRADQHRHAAGRCRYLRGGTALRPPGAGGGVDIGAGRRGAVAAPGPGRSVAGDGSVRSVLRVR
jgi:hypothetical protein